MKFHKTASRTGGGSPHSDSNGPLDISRTWLPFLEPTESYNRGKFRLDLIAALTVALVALPQAMAYALIAGVEPKYGIYALIVGCIVGALFGSSRHLHTGPVNAISMVIAATIAAYAGQDNYMEMIFLLALMTGLFKLGAGLFKIGNLTQFISRSVLVGFMSGAAILIIVNQIPNALGLPRILGGTFLDNVSGIWDNLNDIDTTTLVIGLGTMLLVLVLNRLSPKSSSGVPYVPSYMLALVGAAAVVALFGLSNDGIAVVGKIPATLPPLSMPALIWRLLTCWRQAPWLWP